MSALPDRGRTPRSQGEPFRRLPQHLPRGLPGGLDVDLPAYRPRDPTSMARPDVGGSQGGLPSDRFGGRDGEAEEDHAGILPRPADPPEGAVDLRGRQQHARVHEEVEAPAQDRFRMQPEEVDLGVPLLVQPIAGGVGRRMGLDSGAAPLSTLPAQGDAVADLLARRLPSSRPTLDVATGHGLHRTRRSVERAVGEGALSVYRRSTSSVGQRRERSP